MTYTEMITKAKKGKICMLPNFEGYFKWDYDINDLIFKNNEFRCLAKELNIQNRKDFYYIT